ncbi:lymphocyte function-associated antigen 3-like [Brachyistius frenatus]|uniref:lymphocyte function-associated antigen 3-like n=1 Tax=Brachyistius frenatus TaxID=100188 RepID=UPI0037E79353
MERLDGVLLLTALLLAGLKSAEAQNTPSYFGRGGTLVLRPVPVPVPGSISSLVWKHNGDLVGEWFGSFDPDYYRSFKGRTVMNKVTGELEISNVTAADNGVYSVGINNQDQKVLYQAEEIQDVPQPEVLVRPLACSLSSTSCTLSCDGDTKQAGPVYFFWRKDGGEWKKSEKDLVIKQKDSGVMNFTCRMENPTSHKESKPKPNPLYDPSPGPGPAVIVVPVLLLAAAGGVGGFCLWKKGFIHRWFNKTPL